MLVALPLLSACALVPDSDFLARMDLDGDGTARPTDCDDLDASVQSRIWHPDGDEDGFGTQETSTECAPGAGWSETAGDCNDVDAAAFPGATERCNEADDDCDGSADNGVVVPTWYVDVDGDGYGVDAASVDACVQPAGYAAANGDCNDEDNDVNPALVWYADADGDTFGDTGAQVASCECPPGYVADSADCDDSRADVSPAGAEVCDEENADEDCNGLTDDADSDATGQTQWYADADEDGFGGAFDSVAACDDPGGRNADASDCDDADPSVTDSECLWVDVAVGSGFTCGIRTDGSIECWGADEYGFGVLSPPAGTFTAIAASTYNACAIASDGSLQCWGYEVNYVNDAPAGAHTQVDLSSGHGCARRTSGEVDCWGEDDDGFGYSDSPTGTFDEVAVGSGVSCALASGAVTCWPDYWSPTRGEVKFAPGASELSVGSYAICALDTLGEADCFYTMGWWDTSVESPPSGPFVALDCAHYSTPGNCTAIRTDGTLVTWGDASDYNGFGSPPAGTYAKVRMGAYAACGIYTDGGMTCWGGCYLGECAVPTY